MFDASCEVAIVGAGPAGALAGILLARQGRRVVLIERSAWPREKTCGGCLSAGAVAVLKRAGLADVLVHAQPLHRVRWHVGSRCLDLPTPGGYALARSEFDALLVEHARAAGCTFLPGTSALLEGKTPCAAQRTLTLHSGGTTQTLRASAVLAADGIAGTSLAKQDWARWELSAESYIGVAATCASFPDPPPRGEIHMHAGPGGYVGLVRLPDGRIHVAAAISPAAARRAGSPAAVMAQILGASGRPAPVDLPRLHGTPYLSRHRNALGAHRVLAIGDACSYVEPFTGEGIAWALKSAEAVVALLPPAEAPWPDELPHRWLELHREVLARSQWLCRTLRPMMHAPALAAAGLIVGNALPPLRRLIAAQCS